MIVHPDERYKLIDLTDNYGLVGYYSTLEDMQEAAEDWRIDTDGDCNLLLQMWDEDVQAYVPVREEENDV